MTFLAGLAASVLEWCLSQLVNYASVEFQAYKKQQADAAQAAADTAALQKITPTSSATDTGKAIDETLNHL